VDDCSTNKRNFSFQVSGSDSALPPAILTTNTPSFFFIFLFIKQKLADFRFTEPVMAPLLFFKTGLFHLTNNETS